MDSVLPYRISLGHRIENHTTATRWTNNSEIWSCLVSTVLSTIRKAFPVPCRIAGANKWLKIILTNLPYRYNK